MNLGDLKESNYRNTRGILQIYLVIDITFWDKKGELYTKKALIDSSTKANIILQRLVKEYSWSERGLLETLREVESELLILFLISVLIYFIV